MFPKADNIATALTEEQPKAKHTTANKKSKHDSVLKTIL